MFPICMRKLDDIPVRQMYRWKARFMGFWRYIHFQDQRWGLWEISKNVTIVLRNLRPTQQTCRRNMHIHEWTPRRSSAQRMTRTAFRVRMLVTARPVCDSAATGPCSQITLGRLVVYYYCTKSNERLHWSVVHIMQRAILRNMWL